MKESLAKNILGHLLICVSRLAINSLFIPYGQTLGRTLRKLDRVATQCTHDFSGYSRNTVSVTLQRMKKKELVSVSGANKGAIWKITKKGRSHFRSVEVDYGLPPEDGKTRLFMFDIPEDRKGERNWLRAELVSCDYTPLQKSVFIGKRPLPAKLFKELDRRDLLVHVQVVGLDV